MKLFPAQRLIATVGLVGYLRLAPGTWGSLVAIVLAIPVASAGGRIALGAATAFACALGIWASDGYARMVKRGDPSEVVIDEVAGIWLVFTAVPLDVVGGAAGFALFRFFDIVKPWPISWLNKHVPGGLGIMIDDVAAALAAIGTYWLVDWIV